MGFLDYSSGLTMDATEAFQLCFLVTPVFLALVHSAVSTALAIPLGPRGTTHSFHNLTACNYSSSMLPAVAFALCDHSAPFGLASGRPSMFPTQPVLDREGAATVEGADGTGVAAMLHAVAIPLRDVHTILEEALFVAAVILAQAPAHCVGSTGVDLADLHATTVSLAKSTFLRVLLAPFNLALVVAAMLSAITPSIGKCRASFMLANGFDVSLLVDQLACDWVSLSLLIRSILFRP